MISTHITSTVINIMWDELASEDENGIIRYYLVNVTETNTGYHYQTTSTTSDIALSNLHPYYTYSITVAAYTIEEGPFSNLVSFTTLQDGMFSSGITHVINLFYIQYLLVFLQV